MEDMTALLSFTFGHVHRDVCFSEQISRRVRSGCDRDADARADHDLVATYVEGGPRGLKGSFAHRQSFFHLPDAIKQDRELISTQAGRGIFGS
jgi:hypothetical protein